MSSVLSSLSSFDKSLERFIKINKRLMLLFCFLSSTNRHTERVDQEDGSKRTRVRFNIEGPHGNAFVFAEVSSDMPSGEFVYGT